MGPIIVPTEAEGRREAYQGFSNASPDSAVTTHVWKRDVIGAPILRSPHPTRIFDFNWLNRHAQQECSDCQPQTEQRRPIQMSLWGMHHLHWPCRWRLPCKTAQANWAWQARLCEQAWQTCVHPLASTAQQDWNMTDNDALMTTCSALTNLTGIWLIINCKLSTTSSIVLPTATWTFTNVRPVLSNTTECIWAALSVTDARAKSACFHSCSSPYLCIPLQCTIPYVVKYLFYLKKHWSDPDTDVAP